MLGREYHVAHPGIAHDTGPFRRVERSGTELVLQPPVPPLVVLVVQVTAPVDPVHVLRAYRPGLDYPGNRVQAPVEEHPELEVLPLAQLFPHSRILRRIIRFGCLMDIAGKSLGRDFGMCRRI